MCNEYEYNDKKIIVVQIAGVISAMKIDDVKLWKVEVYLKIIRDYFKWPIFFSSFSKIKYSLRCATLFQRFFGKK